ncbi:AAA family ATPase [Rhodococcus sp. D2-41]|uniref:AAA family ATPase n=1 Tax=Speluncibacter jeojiensis TaxID=2710754 RepID=A0A9X4M857_9ACTN|nr:AAA family ATPase [Rhodococcus sp. D2-41]MDG3009357.1 AAA family ATPase [Rhodococcus sp. D2-41]MDG3017088.1 AAA family ATPase [Corynebacteriales bacterium D3-21]
MVPAKASSVRLKRVRWAMEDWFVVGGVNLLAGREGLGKSTIAVDIAAKCTRGELQGEYEGVPVTVIYAATEDDPAFTVAPRLRAAGADLDRVLFVSVHTPLSNEGVLSLPGDLAELERVITQHDVKLLILDAATSVMDSRLDGHDDRKVRQFLEPLAQSAGRLDYTVIGLCHFGKRESSDPGKLILGSLAWSQVARSVVSVARDDENDRLVVTNTKGNLATRTRSMAAQVVSATVETDDGPTSVGRVEWLGEADLDARELLGSSAAEREDAADIDKWLDTLLIDNEGALLAKDVFAAADACGYSRDQVKRAKKRRGIVAKKSGNKDGAWFWMLPARSEADN